MADFMNVRFDMIGAYMAGEHGHPQKVMEEHGFHVTKGDPISIADCWIFQIVPPYPEGELPKWLKRVRDDRIFDCDK